MVHDPPFLRDLVGFLLFVGAVTVPGTAILFVAAKERMDVVRLLVFALPVSIAYTMVVGWILLVLQVFSLVTVCVAIFAPALALAFRWRRFRHTVRRGKLGPEGMAAVGVGLALVALIAITPAWNFLIAPNQDAGNYEAQSNHYARTGSYWYDGTDLSEQGAQHRWLRPPGNTWQIDDSGRGTPLYMPGYPVLLGVAKTLFGTVRASWFVNAAVAVAVAMMAASLIFRLARDRTVSAFLAIAVICTPLFFYYAKQLMSEQLGLLGVLVLVYAFVTGQRDSEATRASVLSAGFALMLLPRLDLFAALALLLVGVVVAWRGVDEPGSESVLTRWSALASGLTIVVVSIAIGALGASEYVNKFSIGVERVAGLPFVVVYGVVLGIAWAAVPWVVPPVVRLVGARGWQRADRIVWPGLAIAWVLFVAWNLFLRWPGVPFEQDHHAYNLLRLFDVYGPPLMVLVLAAVGIALATPGRHRAMVLFLTLAFALTIVNAEHTPPDLWWMRRYLASLVPLTVVTVPVAFVTLRERWRRAAWLRPSLMGLVVLSLGYHVVVNHTFFRSAVNPEAPQQLAALDEAIPSGAGVVALQGDRIVRGMTATFRSVHDGDVLLEVPPEEAEWAVSVLKAGQAEPIAIVAPQALPEEALDGYRLELVESGEYTKQWVDDLARLRAGSPGVASEMYWVYKATSTS